jgi:hypothetical protein
MIFEMPISVAEAVQRPTKACNARPVHTDGPLTEMSGLLDHLGGDRQYFIWNDEAQCLNAVEIDHQFEFGGRLDGKLAGLG